MDFSLLEPDLGFRFEDYFPAVVEEFKLAGKDVEIKTKELGRLQGKLVRFDAEQVEIMPAPKKTSKKKAAEEPVNLTLDRKTTEIKPAIIF